MEEQSTLSMTSQQTGIKEEHRPPRHRSCSILSNRTNTTWRSDVFGRPRIPRGGMVFTGPDSLRMHRQKVLHPDYVGEGEWTPERTSTISYITRGAPNAPHPRPKSAYVGAYGWGVWGDTAELCTSLSSGHQIKLNTFRQLLEDSASHRYQEPWYPKPSSSGSRASSSNKSVSKPSSGRLLSRQRV